MVNARPSIVISAFKFLSISLVAGACCGVVFGLFALAINPAQLQRSIIASWMVSGTILATIIWLGWLLRLRRSLRSGDDSERHIVDLNSVPECKPPAPFLTRLARYLNCDESDLAVPKTRPQSRMKFWTTVSLGHWHGPKSASLIRQILERIRQHIHGE
jgi:hypothetical protein